MRSQLPLPALGPPAIWLCCLCSKLPKTPDTAEKTAAARAAADDDEPTAKGSSVSPNSSLSLHHVRAAFLHVVGHVLVLGRAALKPPQFQQNLHLQDVQTW